MQAEASNVSLSTKVILSTLSLFLHCS